MFQFFRSIGQKLLQQGKVKRYIGYAFGEIVLIVVGILIALQISEWNEDRKGRANEEKILTSLHQDFRMNVEHLDAALSDYADVEQSTLKAMSFFLLPSSMSVTEMKQSGNPGKLVC